MCMLQHAPPRRDWAAAARTAVLAQTMLHPDTPMHVKFRSRQLSVGRAQNHQQRSEAPKYPAATALSL